MASEETPRGSDWKHEFYLDVGQPLARQVGKVAGEFIEKVLLPVRATLWGVHAIAERIGPHLSRKLERIRPENLQPPSPAVAVPVFQALAYTGREEPLAEMFATLLASSMDKETARKAHPSFASILRELVPDEARILQVLVPGLSHKTKLSLSADYGGGAQTSITPLLKSVVDLLFPFEVDAYLVNLSRTGLLVRTVENDVFLVDRAEPATLEVTVKRIENALTAHNIRLPPDGMSQFRQFLEFDRGARSSETIRVACAFTESIRLTEFGELMHAACVTGPGPSVELRSPS